MDHSLKDKAVIVTGGASGIGRATVERLLGESWRVVAADRDEAALKSLADGLNNGRLMTAPLDVTDEAMVEALVARVEADFAPIGGLVNSAGIGRDAPFADTTAKLFRDIYEINVIGTFLVSKAAARSMGKSGGGSIVNIASVSGIKGNMAALGALLILAGIPLLVGGVWLIALGGTWYYTAAGIGLVAAGGLLLLRRMAGVWSIC